MCQLFILCVLAVCWIFFVILVRGVVRSYLRIIMWSFVFGIWLVMNVWTCFCGSFWVLSGVLALFVGARFILVSSFGKGVCRSFLFSLVHVRPVCGSALPIILSIRLGSRKLWSQILIFLLSRSW